MSTVSWIAGDGCPLGKLGDIKELYNVVETILNYPFGNSLYHPFIVLLGIVVYCFSHITAYESGMCTDMMCGCFTLYLNTFEHFYDIISWSGSTPSCHRLFPLVSSRTPSLYCCKAKSQFTGVIHDHTCPVTAPLLTGYSPICVHRWSLPTNDCWWICRYDLKQNGACLVLALVLWQVTPVTPLHHTEFNQGNGRLEDSYFMLPADAAGWSPKLTNHLQNSQCSKVFLMCGSNMPQASLLGIKPLVII